MKNVVTTILCLCLGISSSFAQKKLFGHPIKSVTVFFGEDRDLLSSMDSDYFLSMTKNEADRQHFNQDFSDRNVASMICENPNISVFVGLELPRNFEWNLGINAIFNRVDALTYEYYNWDGANSDYANFSTYSDEIALESSLVKRIGLLPFRNRLGNQVVNLYVGAGTNLGVIFDHEMYSYGSREVTVEDYSYNQYDDLQRDIMDDTEYEYYNEEFDLQGGFTQRVYGQAGIGFTLIRRVEIGVQGKYGVGYRYMGGAGIKSTKLESIGFTLKWLLK